VLPLVGSFVLALVSTALPVVAAPATLWTMTSDPGDFIGQGQTYSYAPADSDFSALHDSPNTVVLSVSSFPEYWWYASFAAPKGQTLVPGIYEAATRFPFQAPNRPGLDVSGTGRGCDEQSGRFVVLEAVYGPNGEVERFAVDFEQHCERQPPALLGSIRYNSDVTVEPRISVASAATYEGNGEVKSLSLVVSLSARASAPVTIDYATADGTARAGVDYAAVSGSATIAAGETAVTVDVPVIGNAAPQPDRTFTLALSYPVGAAIAFGQATGTIVDDDGKRTFIDLTSDPADFIGQGRTFTLTPLDGDFSTTLNSGAVGVGFFGNGGGYPGTTSWGFIFAPPDGQELTPGAYEAATRAAFKSPTTPGLDVYGDYRGCNTLFGRFVVLEAVYGVDNSVQQFAADFEQHCDGYPAALFGSVRYNSSLGTGPRIAVTPAKAYEGDGEPKALTFWVSLSARATQRVSVDYTTVDDTAQAGLDYVPMSGTLTFQPGENAARVDVEVLGNTAAQPDRKLELVLSNPEGAPIAFGEVSGTILDDDSGRTLISFTSEPGDYIGLGQQLTLTPIDGVITARKAFNLVALHFDGASDWDLELSAPIGQTLVLGAYEGATRRSFQSPAMPGLDVYGDGRGCNVLSGRFVVLEAAYSPDGDVQRFAADLEQHCEHIEPALFASLRFNSTVPLGPRLSVAPAEVYEGDGEPNHLTFSLTLSAPAAAPVRVDYTTVDGTALAGADYTPVSGTATFPAGTTRVEVDVPVLGNLRVQGDRTLTLTLSHPVGAPIAFGQATGTILDDDSGRTLIYLMSEPGDWVGMGQTYLLTPLGGPISAEMTYGAVWVTYIADQRWDLYFAAPTGQTLAPGFYDNATLYPFQTSTQAGLNVSGESRGCGGATGSIAVRDLQIEPNGEIRKLAIDFEQVCGGNSGALRGSVRFNSMVPTDMFQQPRVRRHLQR
jgi:hypothetical protein